MNNFEVKFFNKYIPEGHKLVDIVHTHPIVILKTLFLLIGLFVVIPSILYYKSITLQNLIPFYYFESYLIILYIKIIYEIFNWYNDVWIISSKGVISLSWAFLKTNSETLGYENIEGIGVEQNSLLDKVFKKGDLVIHKIGDEAFVLYDAVKPYEAQDIIENITPEKEPDITTERFDKILKSLNGVVGDYQESQSDFQKLDEDEETKKRKYIEKVKKSEGTIDLSE